MVGSVRWGKVRMRAAAALLYLPRAVGQKFSSINIIDGIRLEVGQTMVCTT